MREKELRLALVCYGGISLAVYMHGVTKEVWRLARASRAFHDGGETIETETVYRDLLVAIEAQCGIRMRVLPDIVAGASAGGINGIFLAQAIATGQSLDPLTRLWLEEADVDRLVDPHARAESRLSKFWAAPLAWRMLGRELDEADADVQAEVSAKLTRFVRGRWFEPPFSGAGFTGLLLDAFDAMAADSEGVRLLPDAQPLDLFVTVTDFRGHDEMLTLHSPPMIVETEHRLTLSFRDRPGEPESIGEAAELAFAARATASFPGAFPPFTANELLKVLAARDHDWPGKDAFLSRVLPGHDNPERAVLIDGSVLANAPFAPAIAALDGRPARREVDRRFVYIDPKPGKHGIKLHRDGEAAPGFFATLLGALSDIPREQPIRDNLETIAARTAAIEQTRAVITAIRPDVEARIGALFGELTLYRLTSRRLLGWLRRAQDRALHDIGHAALAYEQLRLSGLRGGDAATGLLHRDRAYRIRHLRLFTRRLAMLEAGVTLDPLRDVAYRLLEALQTMSPGEFDGEAFDHHAADAMAEAIGALPRLSRRAPLLAWLSFPFFDTATFPLLQGQGLDEYDAIKVDRISPEDCASLSRPGDPDPLKGTRFNSFGAFFSRAWRENDYLWSRLHGAERMIDLIASSVPEAHDLDLTGFKARAFAAILDAEEARLAHVAPLIATLRQRVAELGRAD
ncbi:PNPLA domain-containing protein [Sphingomonas antarctica]|uniref:patatin-like protein n=1 Tax=Sphingomonas antarctica TaxID=2040274 RepID=UPI0039EBE33D